MATKRGVWLGDAHCGHLVGLTPPAWWSANDGWTAKFRTIQKQYWQWFDREMLSLPKLDFMIANGDMVDGRGEKSGGSEQITTDTNKQAEMASFVLKRYMSRKTKLYMSYGTGYHTGTVSDTEDLVAQECKAEHIGGHIFVDINGLVLDVKHKTGSSGVPHGRGTAIKRQALWNKLWAEAEEQPNADVYIRSHVHYADMSWNPDLGYAFILPALQGFGSKYGSRQCDGRVHFGFMYVEIDDDGRLTWHPRLAKIAAHKKEAMKV